jgi:hypothetical protein
MSVIQERLQLESAHKRAWVGTILGIIALSGWALLAASGTTGTRTAVLFVMGSFWTGWGIYHLLKVRRWRATFEGEHGRDAGKQPPIP